jgi:hydrogenase expression/formation protein HypC
MCLAIPMKIVAVKGNAAVVSLSGLRKEIDVRFLDRPRRGDYVLVHAGFAIARVKASEAKKTLTLARQVAAAGREQTIG